MPATVLVAYATRSGSTREVAETIAGILRENGVENELRPAKEVRGLEQFQTVVLGAPLYMFHWHADAMKFLARQRAALATRPIAIFALGPFHNDEKEIRDAREQLDKDLAKYPWLKPVDIQVFVGKFDPARLTFPFNLLNHFPGNPMKQIPASDERNWDQIRTWAAALPEQLSTRSF